MPQLNLRKAHRAVYFKKNERFDAKRKFSSPQIFSSSDIKRINFSKDKIGNNILLGKGSIGQIYIGRVIFKDNSVKRVAIKRFNNPINDALAGDYKKVISDLREIKLSSGKPLIPKMDVVKIPTKEHPEGEWMLISPLFGGTIKGSKFYPNKISYSHQNIREVGEIIAKLYNKGYSAIDLFAGFKEKEGVIPLDIDILARKTRQDKVSPRFFFKVIHDIIYSRMTDVKDPQLVLNELYNECLKYLDSSHKKEIIEYNKLNPNSLKW